MKLSRGSSPKPPQFLVDLYADLRDRRLLPLVAVLLVGIVAAPILLKDEGEPERAPPPPVPSASANAASFSVVPAARELRAPKKRLGQSQATNPFKPPARERPAPRKGVEVSVAPGGSEPAVTTTRTETIERTRYVPVVVTPGIDALAGVEGHVKKRPALHPGAQLPSANNPVVQFAGVSNDDKRALFLLSSQVLAYTGKVRCAGDKESCQMIEVMPGELIDFVFGAQEKHFFLTVESFVGFAHLPNGKTRVIRPEGKTSESR